MMMSEEKFCLELLGTRVLTLTAEVRDFWHRLDGMERRMTALEDRFSAVEHRISAMEQHFAVQEERMSAMLSVIVRVAEPLDRTPELLSG